MSNIYNLSDEQVVAIRTAVADNDDLPDDVYQLLFEYFCDNGEMPYSIAKARSGDPFEWISERLQSVLENC